jgi:hypothetical protein
VQEKALSIVDLTPKYRKFMAIIKLQTLYDLQQCQFKPPKAQEILSPDKDIFKAGFNESYLLLDFLSMLLIDYDSPLVIIRVFSLIPSIALK